MPTRRSFLASLSAAIPILAISRAAHAAAIGELTATTTLDALGEVVLPSELGTSGIAREVDAFRRWMSDYRAGVELLHGYGTSALSFAPPTPATRWASQLSSLDATARRSRRRPFASLAMSDRQQLVREALASIDVAGLPPVGRAPHVAIALLSHFYSSPEAGNLCYGARIDRRTCRPLADQRRRPLPTVRS